MTVRLERVFMQLGKPIGFVNVKGERLPIYPSEEFLRMLESMFVNEGVTETELEQAEATIQQTTTAVQTAQQTADDAATAASTAATNASNALTTAQAVNAEIGPILTRLDDLENP